jgi:hypothetical protein
MPTSITLWLKTAGGGGIGSMRRGYDAGEVGNRSEGSETWADTQPVPLWEGRKRQDIGERGIVPEGKVRSATG